MLYIALPAGEFNRVDYKGELLRRVTMAELVEGMHKLGGLRKRPVAPEARDFRYRMLRRFKKAPASSSIDAAEIDAVIEAVHGNLRLRSVATVAVFIGPPAA